MHFELTDVPRKNQLMSHRRTKDNNYSSAKCCEKIVDIFFVYSKEACIQTTEKKYRGSIESRKDVELGFTGSSSKDSKKNRKRGSRNQGLRALPKIYSKNSLILSCMRQFSSKYPCLPFFTNTMALKNMNQ